MADVNVKFIPDTKEVDRELRRPRRQRLDLFGGIRQATGVGAGVAGGVGDGLAQTTRKGFAGIGRLLGGILAAVSVVAIVVSALQPILEPIAQILKAILTIFFLFLIPVFKPLLEALTALIPATKEVSNALQEGAEKAPQVQLGQSLFATVVEGIVNTALKLGGALGQIIFEIGKFFFDLGQKIGQWLFDRVIEPAANLLSSLILDGIEGVKNIGRIILNTVLSGLEFVKNMGMLSWELFKNGLENILQLGQWIWEQIFKPGLEFIADIGERIWNFIKDGLNFISDLGSRIWNVIKNALSSLNPFGKGGNTNVNDTGGDFVITPNGRVIKSSPTDYIMASSDPNKFKGGGVMNYSPTIQIMGGVNNEMDIQEVAMKIVEISKNELSRRTGRNLI